MTTDAPTATNTQPTDPDTTEAEKRRDAGDMAPSRGNGDGLPDAFKPVDEQRGLADLPVPNNTEECRLGYAFGYADALEATDAPNLYRERNRLRAHAAEAILMLEHGHHDDAKNHLLEALQGGEPQ